MENYYFNNEVQNILMVVNKQISYDKNPKGDFSFKLNKLFNNSIHGGFENFEFHAC